MDGNCNLEVTEIWLSELQNLSDVNFDSLYKSISETLPQAIRLVLENDKKALVNVLRINPEGNEDVLPMGEEFVGGCNWVHAAVQLNRLELLDYILSTTNPDSSDSLETAITASHSAINAKDM